MKYLNKGLWNLWQGFEVLNWKFCVGGKIMRKLFAVVMGIIVLVYSSVVCYCGDIPEALLETDSSMVYFGRVKNVNDESITVVQCKNIKGDFFEGRELTYRKYGLMKTVYGVDNPVEGEMYLCGYTDDNNPLNMWKVSSMQPENLVVESDNDMARRLNEYLNSGKFAEKEKERLLNAEKKEKESLLNLSIDACGAILKVLGGFMA